jgi:hypothetical protein
MPIPREKTQWTIVATATAAIATATKVAVPRMRHYITGISLSMRGGTPAVATAEVRSAANVLDRLELAAAVFAPILANFVYAYECGINEDATFTCPSLGAGITVSVVVKGYTLAE